MNHFAYRNGELFAEDWFSLADSDLLLIATIAFGIYLVVKRQLVAETETARQSR